MKCRVWHTLVAPDRLREYEAFAREISLPMFRAQQGYRGVVMAGEGSARLVISLWEDDAAVAALSTSPSYNATVAKILAAGFLTGEQSVELHEVHLADLPGRAA